LQKFLFVVEIFTKYDRGLLFFAAPCIYNKFLTVCGANERLNLTWGDQGSLIPMAGKARFLKEFISFYFLCLKVF